MWKAAANHREPHVMLTLVGIRGKRYSIPCVLVTRSGLTPGLWLERVMVTHGKLGITSGFMYTKEEGSAPALKELEHEFTRMLERVQRSETKGLIPEGIDVGEEFGIARSGRRELLPMLRIKVSQSTLLS